MPRQQLQNTLLAKNLRTLWGQDFRVFSCQGHFFMVWKERPMKSMLNFRGSFSPQRFSSIIWIKNLKLASPLWMHTISAGDLSARDLEELCNYIAFSNFADSILRANHYYTGLGPRPGVPRMQENRNIMPEFRELGSTRFTHDNDLCGCGLQHLLNWWVEPKCLS